MTFKTCTENFPLYDTLVGSYLNDSTFTIKSGVPDFDPFWEDDSSLAFVVFNPEADEFECWSFCFQRVSGYINETDDPDYFYPAVFSYDFNWEKIDPFRTDAVDQVVLPDDELADELGWPLEAYTSKQYRREQIAYLFDAESYENGLTFTSMDSLKKFLMSGENDID